MKKFIVLFVTALFVMNSVLTATAAKTTPKLNKTALTLATGQSYILKLNDAVKNVTWSSSDKKIAEVNKNGKIIAKKEGRIMIIAKSNGENYTCKLTVRNNRIYANGDKFYIGNKQILINGANTPWDSWNDFGGNFNKDFWDKHFKEMSDSGMNASRIWISCNGTVGMEFDKNGYFTGATAKHWSDLDELFSLAEKHGIYIMATVQSFDHYKGENKELWRSVLADEKKLQSYIDNYIIPLVKRYNNNPYFWSVDLCNEPDWIYEDEKCGNIEWDKISLYFAKASASIHKNSDVLVTTGMGIIKYNSDNKEKNVVGDKYLQNLSNDKLSFMDFWSTHWYDWQERWYGYAFTRSPKKFGLTDDRPSVIGECPAASSKGRSIVDEYLSAIENGWSGTLAWTSNGVDACGNIKDVGPAAKAVYEKYKKLVLK